MTGFFAQHAIDNVWCNPDQDSQYTIAGHRVTPDHGSLQVFPLFRRDIALPTKKKRYHVYNIGQVYPGLVTLLQKRLDWELEKWVRVDDYINEAKLFIELLTQKGVQLPRSKVYYMFTNERALIYAVELDSRFSVDYNEEEIFFRLYDNAFYQSSAAQASANFVRTASKDILSMQDMIDIRRSYDLVVPEAGITRIYANGEIIDRIDSVSCPVGTYVEWVHDTSFKRHVIFPLPVLEVFNSDLDKTQKYLIHYQGASDEIIDYRDDIEFEISWLDALGRMHGRTYPSLLDMSKRMVTHRDYSIPTYFVRFIVDAIIESDSNAPKDRTKFRVHLKIRKAGYQRKLVFDNNRIFELYKLSDSEVVEAMIGMNSLVPNWTASHLESSAYVEIMGMKRSDITALKVQEAYGYNALTKAFCETPILLRDVNGVWQEELPYGLQFDATIYEYDANGHLIQRYQKSTGTKWFGQNASTRLIEGVIGFGGLDHSVVYGEDNIPVPTTGSYRVYMSFLNNGESNGYWEDVTGSDRYSIVNGVLKWSTAQLNVLLCVKSDARHYAADYQLNAVGDNLYIDLVERVWFNGQNRLQLMPFPGGDLNVFLNKRSLIKGLDYRVEWPRIYIINREYLNEMNSGVAQDLHVRMTGFCGSDLKLRDIEDFGFVEHGLLSNNHRFDIRDDKVLRITVGGSTKHRSQLKFSEDGWGVDPLNDLNGSPYQIKDVIIPLSDLEGGETTYSLLEKSKVIDKAVIDYMIQKYPAKDIDKVMAIPRRYRLMSPFFARVIFLLRMNYITDDIANGALRDNEVRELLASYEYILDFDPLRDEIMPDDRYVQVVPHFFNDTVGLSIYKYRFLDRVRRIYGNGRVEIQSFVTINNS